MPGPQVFQGIVTAAKRMPKTITVTVSRQRVHPVVGKIQKRRTRMLTHDPENLAEVGDTVRIRNCPPKSAAKRHELIEIVQAARVVAGIKEGVTASQEGSGATLAEVKAEAEAAQATEVLDGDLEAGISGTARDACYNDKYSNGQLRG